MSTYAETLSGLLRALNLVEGAYKPSPGNSLASGSISHWANASDYSAPGFVGNSVDTDFDITNATTFSPSIDGDMMGTSCPVVSYVPPPLPYETFWTFDATAAAVYRYRQQQAVNLGSWFVQENWMVPSLFTCASEPRVAEIDIASGWGSLEGARAVLEHHWDTFVNQSDFDFLERIGINTVRLPIGYWTLGPQFVVGTPFEPYASVYAQAWPRFVRAINMAAAANVGVLVDLHGAPGSQNGQPHSGVSDGWTGLFDDAAYVNKTLAILTFLAEQLQNVTNVVGIEVLNEPADVAALPDFYLKAITAMRHISTGGVDLPIYIHDGFNLQQYSTFLAQRTDFVVEDHHSYFVFLDADQSEPASQHTSDIQGTISVDLGTANAKDRDNLVISEWSCALTAQSLSTQADPDGARRLFCTTQMEVYTNTSAGWSFWAYNKEECETDLGWCFKSAVGRSLPATFYSYGKPPPADPAALQRAYDAVAAMTVPSQSDILKRLDGAWNMTDTQQKSSIQGYSDGYKTAKIFTQYGWSRLGFTEQYMQDSMNTMGRLLPKGMEALYRNGFKVGLADGEAVVFAVLS